MSSTGASHARGDSFARQRSTPSKSSPLSPLKLSKLSPAKLLVPNGAGAAGAPHGGAGPRKRLVPLGLVVLGLLYLLTTRIQASGVQRAYRARKAHRASLGLAGESFVLPAKYLHTTHDTAHHEEEPLVECSRFMLFTMGDVTSPRELNLLIRSAVVASKLNYVFLVDVPGGSLQDFFLPRQIFCRPPRDWFVPRTTVGRRRWTASDRVAVSMTESDALDRWIREEMIDHDSVASLRSLMHGTILAEGDTLPEAMEDLFSDYSVQAKELWRVNDYVNSLVQNQRMDLGLGEGGVRSRKASPSFGGNRRGAAPKVEEGKEASSESMAGGAARGDRGPLIAIVADESAATTSIVEAYARLTRKSTIASPGFSRNNRAAFPPNSVSTLLLQNSKHSAIATLSHSVVRSTSSPPDKLLRQWAHVRPEGERLEDFSDEERKSLPLGLRTLLGQYWVRDLTVSALFTDAAIVSGETGQLTLLLAGEEGVLGPRDITGKGLGGRVRSVNEFWRPTASAQALFE